MKNVENISYWNEEWKLLVFKNADEKYKYKISNYGRIVSFTKDSEKGQLLKLISSQGYKALQYKDKNGKVLSNYIHRLVAEYFLDPPQENQNIVMHIDYNRTNNYYQNLKWGTHRERFDHWKKFKSDWFGDKKLEKPAYSKLTESQVKLIKKKLLDPNRKTRMKIIARRFGVSEMQLYRIKRGENWGYVQT